jgi:carboxymethylenebutenolidase
MMTRWGEGMPTPFELMGNIRSPVYGFFGDLDKNPSPEDVDRFEAELVRHKIPLVFHRYPNVDHGFQNPARKTPHNKDEIQAAQEAWTKMLALMARHNQKPASTAAAHKI